MNVSNRPLGFDQVGLARRCRQKHQISVGNGDRCGLVTEIGGIDDQYCMTLSERWQQISQPLGIRFGIGPYRLIGVRLGRPSMSSAVRVGVQQRNISAAVSQRAGHDGAQHGFAASALAGRDREDWHVG